MQVAIVILAQTEGKGLARVVNALQTAKECKQAGDELRIIFDGAAVLWPQQLAQSDHQYHALFDGLTTHMSVCEYCSQAFGAQCNIAKANEFEGHPSIRSLMADGFKVLTF